MHGHLIEVRSVGGISGSPVYWMSDIYRYNSTGVIEMQTVTKVLLLGLVHGHWDEPYFAQRDFVYPERMNEGMAIVVPAETILEAVNQEVMVEKRRAWERTAPRDREENAVMDSAVPAERDRVSLSRQTPDPA